MAEVNAKLGQLVSRLDMMEQESKDNAQEVKADAQEVKTMLKSIKDQLDRTCTQVSILAAKQHNSSVSRSEGLRKVPLPGGAVPPVDFPTCIMELVVAGDEKLPDGTKNTWNHKKSKALLQAYGEDSGTESDPDGEQSETAQRARWKVARCLGVTQVQLNFALLYQ